jgi:hypothetical protein
MKKPLLKHDDSSDAACISAWNTLKASFLKTDLLMAIYGGIMCGDIEYSLYFHAARRHDSPWVWLEPITSPQLHTNEHGTIFNRASFRFADMIRFVDAHSFTEEQKRSYAKVHCGDEFNVAKLNIEIGLVDPFDDFS